MTMIAFACKGDTAEFMTDSANYTPIVTSMGTSTKHITLPHFDTAVLTQGDLMFGIHAKSGALQVSGKVATFDELADSAPEWLAKLWADRLRENPNAVAAVVFLVGYSPRAGKFVGYGFPANDGFKPFEAKGLWVIPAPWSIQPTAYELGIFRDWCDSPPKCDDTDELCRVWSSRKPLPPPRDLDEWRDLAMDIREQRALESFSRIIVAGQVFHTRLGRGTVHTQEIHRFDDSGDEFLRLIAFTQHPQAQVMECHCGSGERFVDCCLAPHLDEACGCGTAGKTFRACCMVAEVARPVGAH